MKWANFLSRKFLVLALATGLLLYKKQITPDIWERVAYVYMGLNVADVFLKSLNKEKKL